jgi:hypothetical protein
MKLRKPFLAIDTNITQSTNKRFSLFDCAFDKAKIYACVSHSAGTIALFDRENMHRAAYGDIQKLLCSIHSLIRIHQILVFAYIQTITYIHFNDPPFLHLEMMIRSTMPKNQGLTAFLSNGSSVWLSRFSKRNPHIRKIKGTSLCYQGDFALETWCHPSFMQTKKATFQPSVHMPKT